MEGRGGGEAQGVADLKKRSTSWSHLRISKNGLLKIPTYIIVCNLTIDETLCTISYRKLVLIR
jgi:hypothetical protein